MALLALIAGLLLSGTAAYYSIIGLIAIFPGAIFAISLMGASLEFAKLVAASWLYRNWDIAPRIIKAYFIFAICILMFITSLGTFGYLSKVHLETSTTVADNSVEITRISAEIENEKFAIQNSQNSLNLMNKLVAENSDPDRANRIRVRQAAERSDLNRAIQNSSNRIMELNKELAPLQKTNLKAEAEIGPLKYVAELIYGETAKDHFDSAVRFVIILIVLVFDPLAVLLLIAANISWNHKPEERQEPIPTSEILTKPKPKKKVVKNQKMSYNSGIKIDDTIYNFMMKDDFGIQHLDKVNENESTRKTEEK